MENAGLYIEKIFQIDTIYHIHLSSETELHPLPGQTAWWEVLSTRLCLIAVETEADDGSFSNHLLHPFPTQFHLKPISLEHQ